MRTVTTAAVLASDDLRPLVADAVRAVRRSARDLTDQDQAFLTDVARGRYVGGMLRFARLARRCDDPIDASWFAEVLRGYLLKGHPGLALNVHESFRAETLSNTEGDLAQIEFLLAPTPANRERAIDALHRQFVATRATMDALHCAQLPRLSVAAR